MNINRLCSALSVILSEIYGVTVTVRAEGRGNESIRDDDHIRSCA